MVKVLKTISPKDMKWCAPKIKNTWRYKMKRTRRLNLIAKCYNMGIEYIIKNYKLNKWKINRSASLRCSIRRIIRIWLDQSALSTILIIKRLLVTRRLFQIPDHKQTKTQKNLAYNLKSCDMHTIYLRKAPITWIKAHQISISMEQTPKAKPKDRFSKVF